MHPSALLTLLQEVQSDAISIEKALARLGTFPSELVADACLDHQRFIRTGTPGEIYGASKSAAQIAIIAEALLQLGDPVLPTRVDPEKADKMITILPQFCYVKDARMIFANRVS